MTHNYVHNDPVGPGSGSSMAGLEPLNLNTLGLAMEDIDSRQLVNHFMVEGWVR